MGNEEVYALIRLAKGGDKAAEEELLTRNVLLIKSIISRYRNKGVEYDDLYQLASLGFIKAVKNFDEKYGVRFSTYAVPMIAGEIKRFMRDDGSIKVSRALKTLSQKMNKYLGEEQAKGNSPTVKELAEVFGVEEENVIFALDSNKMPISIFAESDNETELVERLGSNEEELMVDKINLKTIIEKLPDREKKIIILRYYRDKTQGEVAAYLGVSQVQVSRIENKIIEKMRDIV